MPDRDPLDRTTGELQRANDALHDYYNLGSARSLGKLLDVYQRTGDADPVAIAAWESRGPEPPTRRRRTLEQWSSRWHWQERVDAQRQLDLATRDARRDARRQKVEDQAFEDAEHLRVVLMETMNAAIAQFQQIEMDVGASLEGNPTVNVRLDVKSLRELVDARDKIDQLTRRALGLPERVTQTSAEISGPGGEAIQIDALTEDERAARVAELLAAARRREEAE